MTESAVQARRKYQREYQKKWRAKNPQKEAEIKARYWAKKAAAEENGAVGSQ